MLLVRPFGFFAQVQVHLAARNPEQEKLEAEKRAEELAKLRYVQLLTQ
jgi:hypothetical protein